MRPHIDIRAGVNIENDTDGTDGRKDKSMVELVLRYNVFDGGTNEATARRLLSLFTSSRRRSSKRPNGRWARRSWSPTTTFTP